MQNYKIKLFDFPGFVLINFLFELYTNLTNISLKNNYTLILKTINDNDERK